MYYVSEILLNVGHYLYYFKKIEARKLRRVEDYYIQFIRKRPIIKGSKGWSTVYDWVASFEAAVAAVLILFTFFVRPVKVSGESMRETLQDRDWVAVSSISSDLDYGDIVVVNLARDDTEPLIKRVIAMEGDIVFYDMENNQISVQRAGTDEAVALKEKYIVDNVEERHFMYTTQFPYVVEPGKIFVMGDNRNNSKDSRMEEVGTIDRKFVMGKAQFRIIPFGKFNIYNGYNKQTVYGLTDDEV